MEMSILFFLFLALLCLRLNFIPNDDQMRATDIIYFALCLWYFCPHIIKTLIHKLCYFYANNIAVFSRGKPSASQYLRLKSSRSFNHKKLVSGVKQLLS